MNQSDLHLRQGTTCVVGHRDSSITCFDDNGQLIRAARLPHPSLDFTVSDKRGRYGHKRDRIVCTTLRQVFERGGKPYQDHGSEGTSLFLTIPEGEVLPVKVIAVKPKPDPPNPKFRYPPPQSEWVDVGGEEQD